MVLTIPLSEVYPAGIQVPWGFPSGSMVKNLSVKAGDSADSTPELGRSPGGGSGNSLQYSYLENPRDRGTWQATVHEVAKELDMTEQLNNNHTMQVP